MDAPPSHLGISAFSSYIYIVFSHAEQNIKFTLSVFLVLISTCLLNHTVSVIIKIFNLSEISTKII